MKKTIVVDLEHKADLVSRYNDEKVDDDLIEYLIKQGMYYKRSDKFVIVVEKSKNVEQSSINYIKAGLNEAYNKSLKIRDLNNLKQIGLFFMGIFFLTLSTLVDSESIWYELMIIGGWVPIWEMIEVELFPDVEERRKRKVIKKLLKSEIVERTLDKNKLKEIEISKGTDFLENSKEK